MEIDPDELERRWQALPAYDDGTVHVLVVRIGAGAHQTPRRITLSPDDGVIGDRWSTSTPRDVDAQLTLMERRVAALVTGGAAESLHVPGDNLVVDLDLSLAASPVGTRLAVGTAQVEITAKPHAGCDKFRARVGDDVLRWVNAREHRDRRLRGVHARILVGGEVAVGDRITRIS